MSERLNIWCPLPPSKSGTANYLAEQIPSYVGLADVNFVVESETHKNAAPNFELPVITATEAHKRPGERHLIHLANNPTHNFCWRAALELKCDILLHDLSLHHAFTEMSLASRPPNWDQYFDVLAHDAGVFGRRFAASRKFNVYTERLQFYVRCLEPVIERANNIIVHSMWANEYIRFRAPEASVHWIPLQTHSEAAIERLPMAQARKDLDLEPNVFLIAIPGFLSPNKDVGTVLRIAAELNDLVETRVLVAGEGDIGFLTGFEKKLFDRMAKRLGFLPDADFEKVFSAADVISCIRYPSTGESSSIFAKAVGAHAIPLYANILGSYEPSQIGIPLSLTEAGIQEAVRKLGKIATDKTYREQSKAEIIKVSQEREAKKTTKRIIDALLH